MQQADGDYRAALQEVLPATIATPAITLCCPPSSPYHAALWALFVLFLASSSTPAQQQGARPAEVEGWVQDLASSSFEQRNDATSNLVRAGSLSVSALTEAALHGELEVSLRSVNILQEIYTSEEISSWQEAGAALRVLAHCDHRLTAALAREILDAQLPLAVARLQGQGAKFQRAQHVVILNDQWTGGDAGLSDLRWLPELEVLRLDHANLTDEALRQLKWHPDLKELVIIGVPVTDKGLSYLTPLRSLQVLHLAGTRLTDPGLAHLRAHQSLRWLDLSGTAIDGSGLKHLHGLPRLKALDLSQTRLDPRFVDDMRTALPRTRLIGMRR